MVNITTDSTFYSSESKLSRSYIYSDLTGRFDISDDGTSVRVGEHNI